MKTIILCGGKGTRYNQNKPKALAQIGDKPIIHYILEIYTRQGFNDFILALGYKKEEIINYFKSINHRYNIEFVNTGLDTNTGGRIKKIEPYIKPSLNFFCTYGDGLANVNFQNLLNYHIKSGNIATITTVRPFNQFGILILDNNNQIIDFKEKPKSNDWINGGFFVFSYEIFDYINTNDVLETQVFSRLIQDKKIGAYKHERFWETLNTAKDEERLNELYHNNKKEVEWYNII